MKNILIWKSKLSKGKLVKISNGISPEGFYIQDRCIFNQSEIEILCIGNMNGKKGQDILLKAIAELLKRGIKCCRISFIGEGKYENDYKLLANKLNLDSYVTFYGKDKNVASFYHKADIMVMSSSSEAFGRATIEAMLSCCLIIGSNSGATPELLDYGNNGFLFEKENFVDLADKIEYAIKNRDECSKIAKKAQDVAFNNYTAEINAYHVHNLYSEIEREINI